MKVMKAFTVRSLVANKVRTIVTVIGVALAAALLVGVLGSYSSLVNYLYNAEVSANGTWMASVMIPDNTETRAEIETAKNDPQITSFATLQDVGFVELDEEYASISGKYLPIMSAEGDIEDMCGVQASEGRLPEGPNEIMLASVWKERFGAKLGDILSFDVGQRQIIGVEGVDTNKDALDGGYASGMNYQDANGKNLTVDDNTILNSSNGYFEASVNGESFAERLIDVERMDFEVTGFYSSGYNALSTETGFAGMTTGVADASGYISCFMDMDGVGTNDELKHATEAIFKDAYVQLHTNLLRYMGVVGRGAVWDTFFGIVATLAIVIMAACVSLIYNAFAISVGERMQQFGLLSSIGASKRQLRQSVGFEAFIIAIIGIPLGIVVGFTGCAVVFSILGSSISDLLGGGDVIFELVIAPWVIVFAAVITAFTVFVSAWIPALRAGHVSPVAALRQNTEIHLSKRALKGAHAQVDIQRLWKGAGTWWRMFGIGGQLARIEKKRNVSKGRGASISLALAIVLLMTAGSLNTQLGTLIGAAQQGHTSDLGLYMSFENKSNDLDDFESRSKQLVECAEEVYGNALKMKGVEGKGWNTADMLPVSIPKASAGSAVSNSDYIISTQDDLITNARMIYMPEEMFEKYASDNSIDINMQSEDSPIPAIALKNGYGNNGSTYTVERYLESGEGLRVIAGATVDGRYTENVSVALLSSYPSTSDSVDMEIMADFSVGEEITADDSAESDYVSVDPSQLSYQDLNILGLADELPENVMDSSYPTFVLPVDAIDRMPLKSQSMAFTAYFDADDHARVAEEMQRAAYDFANEMGFTNCYCNVQDYIAEEESGRMLVTVVNVFCFLFALILTLIAMANVFNTVTNGLILRRREFAVMRSIGMGNLTFRNMITAECAGYSVRGLIPGVVVSLVISVILFQMVGLSVTGMQYMLPWRYLLLSVLLVAVIMIVSVMYGMHRCKADNVVEALRQE